MIKNDLAVISKTGSVTVTSPTLITTQCLPQEEPIQSLKKSKSKKSKRFYDEVDDENEDDDEENLAEGAWECDFRFGSWTYDRTAINVTLASEEVDVANFFHSDAYSIDNLSVRRTNWINDCCDNPFTEIVYNLKFRVFPY